MAGLRSASSRVLWEDRGSGSVLGNGLNQQWIWGVCSSPGWFGLTCEEVGLGVSFLKCLRHEVGGNFRHFKSLDYLIIPHRGILGHGDSHLNTRLFELSSHGVHITHSLHAVPVFSTPVILL